MDKKKPLTEELLQKFQRYIWLIVLIQQIKTSQGNSSFSRLAHKSIRRVNLEKHCYWHYKNCDKEIRYRVV